MRLSNRLRAIFPAALAGLALAVLPISSALAQGPAHPPGSDHGNGAGAAGPGARPGFVPPRPAGPGSFDLKPIKPLQPRLPEARPEPRPPVRPVLPSGGARIPDLKPIAPVKPVIPRLPVRPRPPAGGDGHDHDGHDHGAPPPRPGRDPCEGGRAPVVPAPPCPPPVCGGGIVVVPVPCPVPAPPPPPVCVPVPIPVPLPAPSFVWVPPVERLVPRKRCVPERSERVWEEALTEVRADPSGAPQTVVVRTAGWRTVIIAAHEETIEEVEVVEAGRWQAAL